MAETNGEKENKYEKCFKETTVEFLLGRIVTAPDGDPNEYNGDGTVNVSIESYKRIKDKQVMWTHKLIFAQADEGIKAYWCPFKMGGVEYIKLGGDADFVFTPTMNGCSFGITNIEEKTVFDKRAVYVAHANCNSDKQMKNVNHKSIKSGYKKKKKSQIKLLKNLKYKQINISNVINVEPINMKKSDSIEKWRGTTFGAWDKECNMWKFYSVVYLSGGTPTKIKVICVTEEGGVRTNT